MDEYKKSRLRAAFFILAMDLIFIAPCPFLEDVLQKPDIFWGARRVSGEYGRQEWVCDPCQKTGAGMGGWHWFGSVLECRAGQPWTVDSHGAQVGNQDCTWLATVRSEGEAAGVVLALYLHVHLPHQGRNSPSHEGGIQGFPVGRWPLFTA